MTDDVLLANVALVGQSDSCRSSTMAKSCAALARRTLNVPSYS